MGSRFGYHQAPAFSYHVIDPTKFKFAKAPHFRPPTPPLYAPPTDPNAPEEPPEEQKGDDVDPSADQEIVKDDTGFVPDLLYAGL